jgi:hypothetical protein
MFPELLVFAAFQTSATEAGLLNTSLNVAGTYGVTRLIKNCLHYITLCSVLSPT